MNSDSSMHDNRFFTIAVTLVFSIIAIFYSTLFEDMYPSKLVEMHSFPWWRLILVLFVLSAVSWSNRMGTIVALVVFFYLSDLQSLTSPLYRSK